MTLTKKILFIISVVLFFPGCASIVSKSSWPFMVHTTPSGAKVTITNKKGREIFTGRTPTALRLKSGAGFFRKESYLVTLHMDGYETKKINVECKINGWYFGNILIGGLLGFLIIDPATGAMYKLRDPGVFEELDKSVSSAALNIINKNEIPKSWEQHLVKIN
jgi:hypothetical protein